MSYVELAVKHFGFVLEEGTTFEDYEQLSKTAFSCALNSKNDGFGDDGLCSNVIWRKGQDTEFYTIIARDYDNADITKQKCLHFEKIKVVPKSNEETGYKSSVYKNKFQTFGLDEHWLKVFEDNVAEGKIPQYYTFALCVNSKFINIELEYSKKPCLDELFSSINLIPFNNEFTGNFKFETDSNSNLTLLHNGNRVFKTDIHPSKIVYSDYADILILQYESFIRIIYGCREKPGQQTPYEDIMNETYVSYYFDFNLAMCAMFIITNKCEWTIAPWEKDGELWRMINQCTYRAHVRTHNVPERKNKLGDKLLTIENCTD